jgi:PKD repeat protein
MSFLLLVVPVPPVGAGPVPPFVHAPWLPTRRHRHPRPALRWAERGANITRVPPTVAEADFGDGGSSSEVAPVHAFAGAGEYTVTLTVTDDDAATGTSQQTVAVSDPPVGGVATFRASASSNANTANPNVTVPPEVQPGDQLLLVITHNRQTAHTAPAGWTLLGQAADGSPDMFSFVYTTTAAPGTAGSVVTSPTALTTKTSMVLLAYADAAPVTTVAASVAGPTVAAHATPAVPIAVNGSVVVNYLSDKTGGNTGWTTPPEVTLRAQSLGSGGGQIGAAAADTHRCRPVRGPAPWPPARPPRARRSCGASWSHPPERTTGSDAH